MANYLLFFAQKNEEDQAVEFDNLEAAIDKIKSEIYSVMLDTDPETMPIITFSLGDIRAVSRD